MAFNAVEHPATDVNAAVAPAVRTHRRVVDAFRFVPLRFIVETHLVVRSGGT